MVMMVTENKRFTSIEKWFDEDGIQRVHVVLDNGEFWHNFMTQYGADKTCRKLNELNDEKEDWKNNCLKTESENSILWNEISILRNQGAEPSSAFKNYLNNLQGDFE